jgi:hypothetical protein
MHSSIPSAPRRLLWMACALALATLAPLRAGAAVFSSRFTYQGELSQGGVPINGAADLVFKLFDAPVAGTQKGNTVTANAWPIANGKFTIDLDFTNGGATPGVYDGQERWLEITVNANVLTPRERLAPSPHAIVAKSLALPLSQTTDQGTGIEIISTANVAQARIIRGETQSQQVGSIAVMGEATGGSPNENVGVFGRSDGLNGFGVAGEASSPAGNITGVYGVASNSPSGTGVLGFAASPTGATRGVYGKTMSPDGYAGFFEGRGFFTSAVGIRTVGPPTAMLEIQASDPVTGWALKVNDELYVDHANNFVGINRSNRIGAEYFGVRAPVVGNAYGGMYMETSSATGKPFYGYATSGAIKVWTEFDAAVNEWKVVTPAFLNPVDRLIVNTSTGNTGVKRSPTANDFEVEGTASKTAAGSWLANSDARIKTDVQTVGDALATLDQVRLVSFKYTDDYKRAHPTLEDRRYLNVIAQEFQKVFPNDVTGSGERLPDGSEILQVDTYPLTIYSAAAVQELHGMLREKDAQLASQQQELTSLRDRVCRLESLVESVAATSASVQAASVHPASASVHQ